MAERQEQGCNALAPLSPLSPFSKVQRDHRRNAQWARCNPGPMVGTQKPNPVVVKTGKASLGSGVVGVSRSKPKTDQIG